MSPLRAPVVVWPGIMLSNAHVPKVSKLVAIPSRSQVLTIANLLPAHAERIDAALRLEQEPVAPPGPHELTIRNDYAGVNAVYDLRLAKGQITHHGTPPFCFGFESVGEVLATGAEVRDFGPGDYVASVRFGHAYRTIHCLGREHAIRVPESSPEILAIVPTGTSALVALEQVGAIGSDENVLVTAAAGGLGHFATQIALNRGNRVTAVCGSDEKATRLAALGCEAVINYRKQNLDAALNTVAPSGFDLIFDSVGGATFDTLLGHIAPRGRLVVAGFTSDADNPATVERRRIYTDLYWKAASVRAFMNPLFPEFQADARTRLIADYRSGALDVWVDPMPFRGLQALPNAVEHLLAGRNLGKVVLDLT